MLSQVSDKTKPFAQLKQPVNRKPLQKEELRNKRANVATSTITKQTRNRGRREGINRPPPTNSERVSVELSRARKFKLKVHQRSERRRRVGTAISTSAVCPRAHQQGRVCVHSAHTHSAASLTNNRKQLFSLTRFKQPRITQEGAARLWFHYSPG